MNKAQRVYLYYFRLVWIIISCYRPPAMTTWPLTKQPLKGIVTPLVTPLLDTTNTTIDPEGTRLVIEHVLKGGVSGIFLLGTTGEAPSLSGRAKREFVALCCQIVQKRVPVLVGISDTSLPETIDMAAAAKEAGATAVVLTTPFYFPLEQPDLLRYTRRVVQSIDNLPVLLYNMPALTKVWFAMDTLRALSKEPNIVGIKDSSGDLEYFGRVCQLKKELRPDWTVFMGPEHLMVDAIRLGADGGVNGGSNVEPRLFVSLCEAAWKGDQKRVEHLMKRVDALQAIYQVGTPGFRLVEATKCALSLQQLCKDVMAEPFAAFGTQERHKVQEILQGLPEMDD
jgi:dihydrodipicolinate synthase/N-acetylneuraminate lyase